MLVEIIYTEGFSTEAGEAVKKLSEKLNVEMPISNAVYEILYGGMSLNEAVKSLLSRSPKPE